MPHSMRSAGRETLRDAVNSAEKEGGGGGGGMGVGNGFRVGAP